ncbi:HlyD family secretion protein [Oceanospirillum linum]|uniref:Secretion protein HlyD n=1 Tax=Oceanospirillum linum TaxID=966 RepID=A0A1T1HD40_OCELI|nr:HlyD family efflux transporter periplasmic adaptor subunit [Oceanospirillum linum]OOV87733.1 secretion protein HlyD [Oceanospirillum linum]SEG13963.1 HlyD family secretion protein [Oleiphilus messinensis]SMP10505.1 HlyD family secretion protein [Oceanospirillum linum]
MKRSITGVILILVAAGGWILWQSLLKPELPVSIASGNGRIEAIQVDVSTKIAGRVDSVLVQEGDLVKPGQVVATIDTTQLMAERLRAEAEIAGAKSQIAAAEASIAQAQAKLILTQQELRRTQELLKKGHASKETYDIRVSEVAVAKANLKAAEAMLTARQRSVDAAQAVAQGIQSQIDDATLVAPSLGRVLYRLAESGEVLGSGGKVLTLVNLTDIYMETFLPSTQAHRVAIGAEARVKLDILDVAIPATVSFVSPESQFTPKEVETASEREKLMFRVKVRIPEELVMAYIDRVKTGIRGVAYIRLSPLSSKESSKESGEAPAPWPDFLQKLPSGIHSAPQTNSQ